jgi:hypothetical protein
VDFKALDQAPDNCPDLGFFHILDLLPKLEGGFYLQGCFWRELAHDVSENTPST